MLGAFTTYGIVLNRITTSYGVMCVNRKMNPLKMEIVTDIISALCVFQNNFDLAL